MARSYRFVLFDCMNTLFMPDNSHLPRVEFEGRSSPSTAEAVQRHLAPRWPHLTVEGIHAAHRKAWSWAAAQRGEDHREVPAPVRFGHMLGLLGIHDASEAEICAAADAHIGEVIGCYSLPPEHRQVLETLQQRLPLGLFSNFDHGPGARRLLARDGLADCFAPVVISAELGWRKPGKQAFCLALEQVQACCGVAREDILFVGDSLEDDVAGAATVGLDVRWFNPSGKPCPPTVAPPAELNSLSELLTLC